METATLDPSNPLKFYAQSLRMAAEAIEKSVNDPRPQNPTFLPAMLDTVTEFVGKIREHKLNG